jgi:hypothetical protein
MQPRFKYPRTPHLPWSPGGSRDDLRLASCGNFVGQEVVVTEKMDGECTTLYPDGLHARSTDSRHHVSRARLKAFHAQIAAGIPSGWRICGEYLYARHSITYKTLLSYFMLFSVWTAENRCLSWRETKLFAGDMRVATPRVLYRGDSSESLLRSWKIETHDTEGYIVRTAGGFPFADFGSYVAKWVHADHIQTDENWRHRAVIPNTLAEAPSTRGSCA